MLPTDLAALNHSGGHICLPLNRRLILDTMKASQAPLAHQEAPATTGTPGGFGYHWHPRKWYASCAAACHRNPPGTTA